MSTTPTELPGASNGKRKLAVLVVLGAFAAAGIAAVIHWYVVGRYFESTDDAYVGGNLVQITSQIPGTVLAIGADDTDFVKAGQTLIQLDKADSRIALDQAEAQLARSVRSVRNLVANTGELEADVTLRQSEYEKAQQDLARRQPLDNTGALSAEDLQHARDAMTTARAALASANMKLAAQRALTDRTTVETHPDVQNAAARVREAYLAYARTALPAPVSGFVARRSVQVGQRVNTGAPLMTVVPLEQVWIDANFKESQLANLRAGQPAKITADAYGKSVEYHGRIAGFSAGTGSAFALLPAQNSTGNWIKVVQRVPVRIALDAKELALHPLQVGLSMEVEIDTHDRRGEQLPPAARTQPAYETKAFATLDTLAKQRVDAIITANGGTVAKSAEKSAPASSDARS